MTERTPTTSCIIDTPYGALTGARSDGVVSFSRVPYASPPVRRLRLRLPEPVRPWKEPLDCTREGPVPPQLPSRLAKIMGDYPALQDEDCLHLDIWVPENGSAETPVFVFLHGGAFMTGGGSLPCYDGALLAKNTATIVVNISYRLGALGFLPIKGVAPANLGLHDQIAALRFIREIAPALGGDAANITVAGQSAGAFSIALLLATPAHRTLFKRSIMMSAPLGLELPSVEASEPLGQDYMTALRLAPDDRDGIEAQPIERLIAAQLELLKAKAGTPGDVTPPFLPVIDGELVPVNPLEALVGGAAADAEVMIGTTREEMTAFHYGDEGLAKVADEVTVAAFRRHYGDQAERAMREARARRMPATGLSLLGDLMTDAVFAGPSLAVAHAQVEEGRSPYVYRFDWQSPTPDIKACHCIELPFLFGNLGTWREAPMLAGADMRELADLSRVFQGALAAFARSGTPEGPGLPAWPDHGSRRVVQHFNSFIQAAAAA
ncbi:carboxylic ester hydrolase [Mesorhizobium sp. L-8-10]|uniref:carboxylesterase/lipase family protein n=1 Tax=Mesorhizobium sp. L-8-10 TaxID=2744523 RepID=UPI0019297722|nr:carboxylesterase family protein [Mesorhizobium sp. L-8-10]BCH30488.1 carboxylic ester hydrolase [Mesorhizobium sp. L-8-10]